MDIHVIVEERCVWESNHDHKRRLLGNDDTALVLALTSIDGSIMVGGYLKSRPQHEQMTGKSTEVIPAG